MLARQLGASQIWQARGCLSETGPRRMSQFMRNEAWRWRDPVLATDARLSAKVGPQVAH